MYFIFYNVFSLRTWETIEQFKWTAEEYDVYFRACLAAEADDLMLTKSFEEGLEKGRKEKEVALKKAEEEKEAAIEKTKKIEKIEMAKSMVLKRINVNTISKITKLSKEEIEKLLP